MPDWGSVFDPTLPLGELVARGSVTFLALLALMRIVGRREAGGLGITDVLLVVLVAEAAAPSLYGAAESVADGIIIVVTVLFWSVVVDAAGYRSPRVARIVKARPRALIEDGRTNRRALRRELMTEDELASQLRLHGITDASAVRRACIEPNGMISIIRAEDEPGRQGKPPPTM